MINKGSKTDNYALRMTDKVSLVLEGAIIILTMLLSSIGVCLLSSVDHSGVLVKRQIAAICGGLIIMLWIGYRDKLIVRYGNYIYLSAIFMMILVDLIGYIAMGAQRWLTVFGVTFQPSELGKIIMIIAISNSMYEGKSTPTSLTFLKLILLYVFPPALLSFVQPSLGSAIVFVMLGSIMVFCGGISILFVSSIILGCALSAPIFWQYLMHDYQKRRILTFLGILDDKLGAGYNIMQSKIAIGSGGVAGCGYRMGTQTQLHFIPETHTDFIFSVLAEEWGMIGVFGVLIVYFLYIVTCYIISRKCGNKHYKLIAMGVGAFIFCHIFINICMISGMMPVVGMPISFLSYGRSHLIACFIASGMALQAINSKRIFGKNG